MFRITRKSWVLIALSTLLGMANLASMAQPEVTTISGIAAVQPATVMRVEISTPLEKLVFERASKTKGPDFEKWMLVSPIQAEADSASIAALLKVFGQDIRMDARVEEGNLKQYGLEDQDARRVELFGEGAVPVVSVVVGKNAVGASSFIRKPGEDTVYRADVGGRARYDKPAAEWRNKQVLWLDPNDVARLELVRGEEKLSFVRGPSTETDKDGKPVVGGFVLEGEKAAIDAEIAESVVRSLARIRVGNFQNPDYDGGFEAPAATATLVMADGSQHRIVLGSRSTNEATYLKIDDIPEVLRVSSQPGRAMTIPRVALADRSVWQVEREDVESVSLTDGGLTVALSPVPDSTQWTVLQPANLDVDPVVAEAMMARLSRLKVEGTPLDDTFLPTGTTLVVTTRSGKKERLEFGQSEKDADGKAVIRVRYGGRVFYLRDSTAQEIRLAFGRG